MAFGLAPAPVMVDGPGEDGPPDGLSAQTPLETGSPALSTLLANRCSLDVRAGSLRKSDGIGGFGPDSPLFASRGQRSGEFASNVTFRAGSVVSLHRGFDRLNGGYVDRPAVLD
jgi:hypothetical protein